MKRILVALLFSCGVLSLLAGTSQAQVVRPRGGPIGVAPYQGPAVSPYVNLTRSGSPAGVNYYGLVRPQIEFSNSIQQLQQDVATNREAVLTTSEAEANLPTTGHATGFMTQAKYFNTIRPGTTSGGALPAQTLPRTTPGLPRFISARGQTVPVVQP